jgi:hypothetical protein
VGELLAKARLNESKGQLITMQLMSYHECAVASTDVLRRAHEEDVSATGRLPLRIASLNKTS